MNKLVEFPDRMHAAPGNRPPAMSLSDLLAAIDRHRCRGRSIVFTNGCFDLFHAGHSRLLEEAAALGDALVVAVNSDASVRRLKGPRRPIVGEAELAAVPCVDHVVVFDDWTPHSLLETIRPDVLVKGGAYTIEEVVGREIVEAYGGRVCLTSRIEGVSTTTLIEAIGKDIR